MGIDKYTAISLAGQDKARVKAFSRPEDDPGYLGGFVASAFSGLPELFGADPTPTAEAFRTENPIAGFVSGLSGMAVPYVGAELAVQRLPGLAKRVDDLSTGALNRVFGGSVKAQESPVLKGIARELIVNAPVEASRLAVGATMYPDNMGDLLSDVGVSMALTGGIGGLGGLFRLGGPRVGKAPYVANTEMWLAPTHQLAAIEEGAQVVGKDAVEFANDLERIVLTENPGRGGASNKELPYVMPLVGQSAEDTAAINSLFRMEKPQRLFADTAALAPGETNPVTGLVKQYFQDSATATGAATKLKPGESEELLSLLPDGLNTTRDIAKNFQYPRVLTVADAAGAREFAGIMSRPGWTPIGPHSWVMQEKDGAFIAVHEILKGAGQRMGKGAGKTAPQSKYLIGKTINPGVLDPAAAAMSKDVTAKWAKWAAPFQERASTTVFSEADDMLLKSISPYDYNQIKSMDKKSAISYLGQKFARVQDEAAGVLDAKMGVKDSRAIQDFAEGIYNVIAPTMHLEGKSGLYSRFFALMRNGQRVADNFATVIMRGKSVPKAGASMASAVRGKGVAYESGFMNHRPIRDVVSDLTEDEVNVVVRLANANKLTPEKAQALVAEGVLTPKAAQAVEELRAINEDVINHLVLPTFRETNHADVEWLKNHLGIPRVARGDFFTEVKNEAGDTVHMAFGKNGRQVEREAKLVVDEAKANGKNWTFKPGQLKHLATEQEDVLRELQENVMKKVSQTSEEGEVIYRAMRRLAALKGTTGKNATIPITSGALKKRTGVQTSADIQHYSHEDLLNSMDGHLRQLLRFTGMQNYKERFGEFAAKSLGEESPKMYDDLMQKGRQFLGLESQITNALNRALAPILGSMTGSKSATKIAAAVNETMYAFTLGFINPSFAVLNLLTPLQTVAPWINMMRTVPHYEAAKMMQFTPKGNSLGKPTGAFGWLEPIKVLGEAMALMRKPEPELKELFQRALDDGVFHPQLFEEWIGKGAKASESLGEAYRQGGMAGFLRKGATWMGEESEKMSRLIAFNAAYKVGKEFFGLEGDALYRFTRRANEVTMFNYHTVDRSKIFTGPVGSMFGLFKNWQMHFIGNLMQYAGLAVNRGNFGPLLWAGGSAAVMGGLGATPLIAVADGIADWNNEANSSYLWMQENFGPGEADAIYFGLPAFAGVSLQASSALPGTDVRNEVSSLYSFAIWNRMKQFGKASEAADKYEDATGQNAMQDPNIRDQFASALLPRAMVRALSITEGDYVRSMATGYPQVRNVSPVGQMLHASGMNIVEVERMQEAGQKIYKAEEQRKRLIEGLGEGYLKATMEGDYDEAERVIQRTIAMGVPLDSVMKSAMQRQKREDTGDILSRYSKVNQAEARDALMQAPQ